MKSPPESKVWDYIIVGTGMGGGPVGLRLSEAGFSVLFLEMGLSPFEATAMKGKFAEEYDQNYDKIDILNRAGRSSEFVFDHIPSLFCKKMSPLLGCGTGGSSALYGAVLERFKRSDFETWPLSIENLTPYYEQAEKLFRVRKSESLFHPGNQKLYNYLKDIGLHPECLPLANQAVANCTGCQSFLCAQDCKNDSGKICIEPAIRTLGAQILNSCEVHKIEVLNHRATAVQASHRNKLITLKAKNIVLAAGALKSPIILQKSGIGQESGKLGRYLMRHFVDLYSLKIDADPQNPISKELKFDDYYGQGGTVQSFGRFPPLKVIANEIPFGRLLTPILKLITQNRLVLASIIQDTPRFENRVWSENGKTNICYKIHQSDKTKNDQFRKKILQLLKPFSVSLIASAHKNKMLAHVCGTCKMGNNPKESVIDFENRVHGLDNLYVVDSSFFPTSAGTNPGLTIAANSLRVADILKRQSAT